MTGTMPDSPRVAPVFIQTGTTHSRMGAIRCQTPIVIALTTEIGSLGAEVAAGLAARLGLRIIRFANVADRVADRLKVKLGAVLRYAEGTASLLERWRIDAGKFFHFTTEEILRLAQDGNVLIEGWEAAKPLWDVRGVISVRVCARTDFRMRVLMNQQGSSDANAALTRIEREAAVRARSVRPYFKIVEEGSRVHDVTFNTERLSVETCVDTIAELAGRRWLPDRIAVRSALADKFLEARIGSAFAEHISPSLAPLGVLVSVAHGRVTLDGISCSGGLRRAAESVARTVSGGLPIENRIVSVPSHGRFQLSECRANNETGSIEVSTQIVTNMMAFRRAEIPSKSPGPSKRFTVSSA